MVIRVDGEKGYLDLLFVSPKSHSKGIGYAAWCEVEKLHPEVTVWETVTPYFEKRNIHFAADFILLSFLTVITEIRTILTQTDQKMSSFRMECSDLRSG